MKKTFQSRQDERLYENGYHLQGGVIYYAHEWTENGRTFQYDERAAADRPEDGGTTPEGKWANYELNGSTWERYYGEE